MKLLLFGTLGCHLCEEAEAILESCEKNHIVIENIDIAEYEQWQDKYAIRIPVLFYPETEKELAWPFTQTQVQTFINELNND